MKSGRRTEVKFFSLVALVGVFLPWLAFAGHGVEDSVDNLPAERVKQLLDAGEKLTFIDMRPAKEYQQTRLPGAKSMPIAEVANRFSEIPKTGRVVLSATASLTTSPTAPCSWSIAAFVTYSSCLKVTPAGLNGAIH